MLRRTLIMCGAISAIASLAAGSEILTPAVYNISGGSPDEGASWSLRNGFDIQPTLLGGVPTGGDATFGNYAANQSGGAAYIDFGAGWQSYRIEQTWTHYGMWKYGGANPFAAVEWDNNMNAADGTLGAAGFNFATNAGPGTFTWLLDTDASANPIVLQARYVKMTFGNNPSDAPNEFAFVVSVPEPSTIGLFGLAISGLCLRHRRRA